MTCSVHFSKYIPLFLILTLANLLPSCKAIEFRYGQYIPNGADAVEYIYGQNGTWKAFTPLNYEWNYYEQYATPEHPFDKGALINAANGSAFYTARDANGYLICDPDHDLEINPNYCAPGSKAFHEHNGVKAGGIRGGNPFTQFWYDDNYLARFMSRAYFRQEPLGLVEQEEGSFVRWSILGGNPSNYWPYESLHFDTLALDGLFYLATDNLTAALGAWNASLELSEAVWNSTERYWNYPGIEENYHQGLWTILTTFILEHPQLSPEMMDQILQHLVSLRRAILRNQEVDGTSGQLLGWISNIGSDSALINTESVSCNVLGLGAAAKYVFEFNEAYPRRKFALFHDKVEGSGGGSRTRGPSFPFPPGTYRVELLLRTRNFTTIGEKLKMTENPRIGKFQVVVVQIPNSISTGDDDKKRAIIAEKSLMGADFKPNDFWSRVILPLEIFETEKLGGGTVGVDVVYDFVVEWDSHLVAEIEISSVIVK